MKRIKAAWDANPRKALLSLCALAVASAVIMASGANFTSTTANPQAFTAGDLKQTNSKNNAAVLSAAGMKPGGSKNGTVTITNTGDIDGVFTLSKSVGIDPVDFAGKLDLDVVDCKADGCGTGTDTPVYSGKVGAMPAKPLGTFAPGDAHEYKFTATFPEGGSNGADNAYKGANAAVTYNWESVNN